MTTDTLPSSKLQVKVIPGASKSEIAGWLGEHLKVRVAAAPEKGKANVAVVTLLAARLGLPRTSVAIASGKTSQKKIVEIHGLSLAQIKRMLSADDV